MKCIALFPFVASTALVLSLSGCGTSPKHTHRPDLLDDKVTAERVKAALDRSGPEFKDIDVQASNGRVMLGGRVPSAEAKGRAEQIALSTHRVKDIDDRLEVRP